MNPHTISHRLSFRPITVLLSIFLSFLFTTTLWSDDVDVFRVTSDVAVENPRPFGTNVSGGWDFGGPWSSYTCANCWVQGVSFEPIIYTHEAFCDGGGEDYLEHQYGGGLHYYKSNDSGFWDGAYCRVMRVGEDGIMRILREDKVKKSISGVDTENRLYFEKSGPPVRSGDMYFLKLRTLKSRGEFLNKRYHKGKPYKEVTGILESDGDTAWELEEDPCPEGGSTTSLKLTLKNGTGEQSAWNKKWPGIWHWYLRDDMDHAWLKFNEGKDYRFQVWLKQKGVPEGKVEVTLGDYGVHILDVTEEWKKYEIDLKTDEWGPLAQKIIDRVNTLKTSEFEDIKTKAQEVLAKAGTRPYPDQSLYKAADAKAKDPAYWEQMVKVLDDSLAIAKGMGEAAIANDLKMINEFKSKLEAAKGDEKKMKELPKHLKRPYKAVVARAFSVNSEKYYKEIRALVDEMIALVPGEIADPELDDLLNRIKEVKPLDYNYPKFSIRAKEGTLWVDNMNIWQTDLEQFQVYPWVADTLKAFKGGSLRIWEGLYFPTVDSWIRDGYQAPTVANYNDIRNYMSFNLYRSLTLCEYTHMDPWLILHPMLSQKDIDNLMEYLYAPPDVGYGKIRASQGHPEPWAKSFKKIFLEAGNEAWNAVFHPKAWPGQPERYARLSDMLLKMIKDNKYFNDDQIDTITNGWSLGTDRGRWSQKVAAFSKHAEYLDYGHYFGGWDGLTVLGENDEELFSDLLMYSPHVLERFMITGLNMDPNIDIKLSKIFVSDKDLYDKVYQTLKAKPEWTPETLALGDSPELSDQLLSLFEADKGFLDSVKKKTGQISQAVQAPILETLLLAASKKEMAEEWGKATHTNAEFGPILMKGAIGGPGEFDRTIKGIPEAIPMLKAYLESDESEGMIARSGAREEIEKLNSGGKAGWGLVNFLKYGPPFEVFKKVKESPQMQAAWEECLDLNTMQRYMKNANSNIDKIISNIVARKGEQIIAAIKSDKKFAKAFMEASASGKLQGELSPACKPVADVVSQSLETALDAPMSPWTPYIRLKDLPPELSVKIQDAMRQGAQTDISQEDTIIVEATIAILEALSGNKENLKALVGKPEFKSTIIKRIRNAFADELLKPPLEDATIAAATFQSLSTLPRGNAIGQAVYESGPGYSLPAAGKDPEEESERVGKSLALGIVTLDSFMAMSSMGFGPQGYFNFKMGSYWSTHNNSKDLFPHPSWQTLQMRNEHCSGKMMKVAHEKVKTIDIPTKDVYKTDNHGAKHAVKVQGRKGIPLLMCYAFKDGNKQSILLFNRSFKEARTAEIKLPSTPSENVTIHKLTHKDPRATNRKVYQVKPTSEKRSDFKNGYRIEVPPSSLIILTSP